MYKRLTTKVAIFLAIGAFLAFVLPGILTQKTIFYSWNFLKWDFTETGPIGDTIGGIAGPILNFIGLILIYLTFQQQAKALAEERERNQESRNADFILKMMDYFKEDAEKVPELKLKSVIVHSCSFVTCAVETSLRADPQFKTLSTALIEAVNLSNRINSIKMDSNDRALLKSMVRGIYLLKIATKFPELQMLTEKCPNTNCQKIHIDEYECKQDMEEMKKIIKEWDES